jgi:hypothetical protein
VTAKVVRDRGRGRRGRAIAKAQAAGPRRCRSAASVMFNLKSLVEKRTDDLAADVAGAQDLR